MLNDKNSCRREIANGVYIIQQRRHASKETINHPAIASCKSCIAY